MQCFLATNTTCKLLNRSGQVLLLHSTDKIHDNLAMLLFKKMIRCMLIHSLYCNRSNPRLQNCTIHPHPVHILWNGMVEWWHLGGPLLFARSVPQAGNSAAICQLRVNWIHENWPREYSECGLFGLLLADIMLWPACDIVDCPSAIIPCGMWARLTCIWCEFTIVLFYPVLGRGGTIKSPPSGCQSVCQGSTRITMPSVTYQIMLNIEELGFLMLSASETHALWYMPECKHMLTLAYTCKQ